MIGILKKIKGDRVIWMVVILLSVMSLLAVYSSTGTLAYKYQGGNTYYYMIKQFIILLFGLGLMYLAHLIKYTYFSRVFQIALYVAIPLLIITIFFGLTYNEATRALPLPFNLSFQTADLAKLTLIMYLARALTKKQDIIKSFRSAFLPLMVPIIIVCALIVPSDFSTAAMLFVTSFVLLFIGRVNWKYLLGLVLISFAGIAILALVLINLPEDSPGRMGTWKARLEQHFNKEKGDQYQVEQAKIAIASGGLLGKGPGRSTQRNFLPHPYSDFIFAIIIEEYGLAGGGTILLLYLILFFRAVKIVARIPRNFGAFLTVGVTFSLVFQALVNMGVAVNLLPVTGQPLPLVSMGGTSIWFTSLSLGIVLSVSRELQEDTIMETEYANS